MSERRDVPVIFVCNDGEDGCGSTFVRSARYARDIRGGVHRQLCQRCARGALRKKPREAPTAADLIFWLERFSDDDIAVFVWAFFGEDAADDLIAASREALLGQQAAVAVA